VKAGIRVRKPRGERRALAVLPAIGHMVPTAGDRDETCQHYSACLTAHVARYCRRSDTDASCPETCRWRERRIESAVDYAIGAEDRT